MIERQVNFEIVFFNERGVSKVTIQMQLLMRLMKKAEMENAESFEIDETIETGWE